MQKIVDDAVKFADNSPDPPVMLAKDLEYPTLLDTDYNTLTPPPFADSVNKPTISSDQMDSITTHMELLRKKAMAGEITIAEAVNLAIHEEMLRDPSTTIQAEDLQAGSSYGIPGMTQQTYGSMRASDEVIDEGHFIGKGIGEAMNGYRPIIELMNTNLGIYGMAEIASSGNVSFSLYIFAKKNTILSTHNYFSLVLKMLDLLDIPPKWRTIQAPHYNPWSWWDCARSGFRCGA